MSPLSSRLLNITIAFLFSALGDAVSYPSRPGEESKPSCLFFHGIKELLGPQTFIFLRPLLTWVSQAVDDGRWWWDHGTRVPWKKKQGSCENRNQK